MMVTSTCHYPCFRLLIISLCCMLCCAACGTANWRAPLESPSDTQQTNPTRTPQPLDSTKNEYRVQAGDTLSGIAWRSQRSIQQLARLNKLRPPYTIRIGQVLRLRPANTSTASRPKKTTPRSTTKPKLSPTPRTSLGWIWPVTGRLLTTFKAGDAVRKGIKIVAKLGTPVLATAAGRVVYSGNGLIGYGPLIIIKHNANYLSAYGHNRKLLVKTGQQIKKGQPIAELGTTNAGKPLLHFEIRYKGKPINPLRILPTRKK